MSLRISAAPRPDRHYTKISNQFIRDGRLSTAAFRVACFVLANDERFTVTQDAICEALNLSRPTVSKALGLLEKLGYLCRELVVDEFGHRQGSRLLISDEPAPQSKETFSRDCQTQSKDSLPQMERNFTEKSKETFPHKKNSKKTKEDQKGGDQTAAFDLPDLPTPTPPSTRGRSPAQLATAEIHDRLHGAINFAAVMGVVRHAIAEFAPPTVVEAAVAVHQAGKPITKATLDQRLRGYGKQAQSDAEAAKVLRMYGVAAS